MAGLGGGFLGNMGLQSRAQRELQDQVFLDATRAADIERQNLALEEERAAAVDRRRDRGTTDAMRAAAQGVATQRTAADTYNAAATAARAGVLGGIESSNQTLDRYDPPALKPVPGRADTFEAMRNVAMQSGDVARATQIDQIMAKLKQEGFLDMTKAALMGAPPDELTRIFNDSNGGTMKYAPGTLKVSPEGIITGINAATGQPTQPFDVHKLAVMTGLVKPDDWEVKDGFAVNKRTGLSKWVGGTLKSGETAIGADGKPVATGEKTYAPNQRYTTIKDAEGNEHLIDLMGGGGRAAVPAEGAAAAGAPSVGITSPAGLPPPVAIGPRIRKEISDAIDDGYKGAMGELTGTAAVRDRAKVVANNLYVANKDPEKGMTPQLSALLARQIAEGTKKIQSATDRDGNVWNVVEHEGKVYPVEPRPAKPAASSAPGAATPTSGQPPAAAIEYLKQNPDAAPAFKEKYGVDPQKYLGQAAGANAPIGRTAAATPVTPARVAASAGVRQPAAPRREPDWAAIPEPPNGGPAGADKAAFNAWEAQWGDLWREKQARIAEMTASGINANGREADRRYRDNSLSARRTTTQ